MTWIDFLYGIITVMFTSGFAYKAYTEYTNKKKNKSKTGVVDAIKTTHLIYESLLRILNHTKATRVILLKVNNGEVIPKPGAELYASIQYEVNDESSSPIKHLWQNVQFGIDYVQMLMRLLIEGRVDIVKPKQSLGAIYATNNVVCSSVWKVGQTPGYFWYISVHFTNEEDLKDPLLLGTMRSSIGIIKKQLQAE